MAGQNHLLYTEFVPERRVKVAWFLLLLIALDLSTAGVCTAGTFPVLTSVADLTMSARSTAHGQPLQNLDDDGCFCCCTHLLVGTHSVASPPEPAATLPSARKILNLSSVPQLPFHPPKR